MQATGVEFNPPQPVCEREMRALETFFVAMHGEKKKNVGASGLFRGAVTTTEKLGVSRKKRQIHLLASVQL